MFLKLAMYLLNREIEKSHNSHGTAISISKMLSRRQLENISVITKEAALRKKERAKKEG